MEWRKNPDDPRPEWKLQHILRVPMPDAVAIHFDSSSNILMIIGKSGNVLCHCGKDDWRSETPINPVVRKLVCTKKEDLFLVYSSTSHDIRCNSGFDEGKHKWDTKCLVTDLHNQVIVRFKEFMAKVMLSEDRKIVAGLSCNLRNIDIRSLEDDASEDSDGNSCHSNGKESSDNESDRLDKFELLTLFDLDDPDVDMGLGSMNIVSENCVCMASVENETAVIIGDKKGRVIALKRNDFEKQFVLYQNDSGSSITCVGFTPKSKFLWIGSKDYTVKCITINGTSSVCSRTQLFPSPPHCITTCAVATDDVIVTCLNGNVYPLEI